jgi:SPP1 gp7 family putative phage head morphogenesis protein
MGVPFNMINQKLELGFDDIEGGDSGYLPAGLMPSDVLLNPPEPQTDPSQDPQRKPNPDEEEDTDPEKKSLKRFNLRSDLHKEKYAQEVDRMRNSWVINLTRKSAKLFEAEGEAVAKALTSGRDWKEAINSHSKKWETFLHSNYQAIVEDFGKEHFTNITKNYKPTENKGIRDFFNPYKSDIVQYIMRLAGTKVTMVSDWTKQVIGAMVLEAQESNATMDELAKNIRGTYKEFSRYRAFRIARTETQNALGFAQYSAGRQAEEILGEKLIGEWWTSLDDRVRDSHRAMHGKKALLGEKFDNGLLYAGEYTQTEKTGDNINCRCTILHHFEGEEDL